MPNLSYCIIIVEGQKLEQCYTKDLTEKNETLLQIVDFKYKVLFTSYFHLD